MVFLGWFGPRGLATIVFGLLSLEELGKDSPVIDTLGGVIMFTVLLSVFAHGISAAPVATRYGQWVTRTHPPIEGHPSVEPMPSRVAAGIDPAQLGCDPVSRRDARWPTGAG